MAKDLLHHSVKNTQLLSVKPLIEKPINMFNFHLFALWNKHKGLVMDILYALHQMLFVTSGCDSY